jgi:Uma2 family endonuclease
MGAPLTVPRRTLTVDEYRKIGAAGVFREDDRIELIEGELIKMAPIGGRHLRLVNVLSGILAREARTSAVVSTQNPVSLPPDNEPQPDIALLTPEFTQRDEVPTARDVLLIVEISDTTLDYDRDTKVPLYGRFGVPEVWVIDAQTETVSIYLDPGPKGYRRLLTPDKDETLTPTLLPEVKVRLSEIWRK